MQYDSRWLCLIIVAGTIACVAEHERVLIGRVERVFPEEWGQTVVVAAEEGYGYVAGDKVYIELQADAGSEVLTVGDRIQVDVPDALPDMDPPTFGAREVTILPD